MTEIRTAPARHPKNKYRSIEHCLMVSQGDIYDLVQDNAEYTGFGDVAFLFAKRFSRKTTRGNLQIRYRNADAWEKFTNELRNVTGCETINWGGAGPKLVTSDDESAYPNSYEIEDVSESLSHVLLSAYEDILVKDRREELLDGLSTGGLSEQARVIAAISYRRNQTNGSSSIDESFLWDAYNLIETEEYERMARRDILNELVRVGCLARDGSDIYLFPEFASVDSPEAYLPLPTVSDEWES